MGLPRRYATPRCVLGLRSPYEMKPSVPNEYTEHYLVHLWAHHKDYCDENLKLFAETYKEIEGEESLRGAVAEFDAIIELNNWSFLEVLVSEMEVCGFASAQFLNMRAAAKAALEP